MSESPRILEDAIKAALEAGCTCINGGEFHGTSECKSPVVFNGCFEIYLENATKVPLSIRGERPGCISIIAYVSTHQELSSQIY
jgi:hypothetical protein